MDLNGSAAMIATKRSAGIELEVNLRNSLHTAKKAHKQWGSTLALKPRTYDQKSKTGISVGQMLSKKL